MEIPGMISRRIREFREFLLDEDKDLQVRLLRLAGSTTFVGTLSALPFFMAAGYDPSIYCVSALTLILLIGEYALFYFTRNALFTSIVFVYVMNLVLFPLFYVYSGGMYGGVEFMFLCGIIDTMYLLDDPLRAFSCAIFVIWYISVMTFTGYNQDVLHNIPVGVSVVFSHLIVMFFSILSILIALDYESILLKMKHRKTQEAVNKSLASTETKSRFLANMSHELRTPMNAVLGMSSIMQRSDKSGVLDEEISIINTNARDLLDTINSILDYSRLDSHRFTLNYSQFELGNLLRDVIESCAVKAEEKDVEFIVDISPELPNILYTDAEQLETIIRGLINDALDSVDDGRVFFKLEGDYSPDGSRAWFSGEVSDTGGGISKEDLKTIYSSFETYDSRQDSRIKRMGLKYSVFKGILDMLNGSFEIESLENVGTTIHFTFEVFVMEKDPIASRIMTQGNRALLYITGERGAENIVKTISSFGVITDRASYAEEFTQLYQTGYYSLVFISDRNFPQVSDALEDYDRSKVFVISDRSGSPRDFMNIRVIRRPLSSLNLSDVFYERWEEMDNTNQTGGEFTVPEGRVLVVDDNRVNLKVAEALLAKYELDTDLVESGFGAIEKMKLKQYDMVLMDQEMPGMDGNETLRMIRNNIVIRSAKKIPVICMTADSSTDLRDRIEGTGFNDILQKPVKDTELESLILMYMPDEKIIRK